MSDVILFDLDGVITSEEAYWDTAGLVLHELLYSPRYWNVAHTAHPYMPAVNEEESHRIGNETLPVSVIRSLKARSINSNWDTCYAAVCLSLIHLLAQLPDCASLLPLQPENARWIASFNERLSTGPNLKKPDATLYQQFQSPIFAGYSGLDFIARFDAYASELLGLHIEGVFARYSPSWYFCQNLFQEWYLGDALYIQTYGKSPAQVGKPGCVHFERPLLPKEQIRTTLEALCKEGYTLGVSTGRPRQEALVPLENYDLLRYFDERHITTHAEIVRAEAALRARGDDTVLVKPHPYQFLLAAQPEYQVGQSELPPRGSFVVVGDATSDVLGGRAAGAVTVAVLTGTYTTEARVALERSEPDFLIDDMTQLPALLSLIDSLMTIQRLQFIERQKAELLLQRWFVRHMHLVTESVTLTPKAVSLNSFNGVYRASDGNEYFFKTHVEDQGVLEEYYHAELLHNAGYNIVRPLRTMREQGRQMVIYPVVRWPVMFDLMRAVETGKTGDTEDISSEMLVAAEKRECDRLLSLYRKTLASSTAEEHARAPIHQLFWHRIAGERLKSFYLGKQIPLPHRRDSDNVSIPFDTMLSYRWTIGSEQQRLTLGALVERAQRVLRPDRAAMTGIGHGDAHFGNVFLEEQRAYLYFDPAFAGRHSPLLDVIKPLFHNVFAMWMYFPQEILCDLRLTVSIDHAQKHIAVQHNYTLPPVRQALLHTKMEYLINPLLNDLRASDALPHDWLEMMQSALLCCPLLTVNLLDRERIPSDICWLGLTFAVLMGNNGVIARKTGAEA